MENFITKVNVNDKYIYLNYYDNYHKKIKYTKENKEKILNELKINKNNIIKYKEELKKILLYSNIITLIDLIKTIIGYICINQFVFNLFLTIISFYIILFNLLINTFFKDELKNIEDIFKSIKTSSLPNEIKYLEKYKIVNISEYIKRKELQEEFNYYDFEYPGYNLKTSLNNQTYIKNNNGKILEFKK